MAQISVVKKSELEGAMRLDAEYYQPKYLATAKALAGHPELKQFLQRSIIHPTEIKRAYEDSGCPFALSQNIGDNWLDFSQQVFIPLETAKLVSKNKVDIGDILMIRTGQVGKAAPYLGDPPNLYASAHVLIVKTRDIPTAYLSTYLNSKFGRPLLERGTYGALQPELAPSYVETVPIPRLGDTIEREIENMVLEAHNVRKQSESLYLQAEQLLLDEIGFKDLDLSHQLYYTVPFKRTKEANRLDAEHFQPKYGLLIEHLAKTGKTDLLGNQVTQPIRRGLQPTYVEDGPVIVINSKYVGKQFVNIEQAERTDVNLWQASERSQARKHDVIMNSTGRGTIGRANCILHDDKTVVDNHVTIIRTDEKQCNPIYLAVYLNSKLGQMQTEKWLSGSSGQIEIYPSDIARFVIYLPSMEFQQRIAGLVAQAWETRQKARQLLEEAKHIVENIVESKTG